MPLAALEGFVIGVTADRRADEQAELLRRRGATVVHAPTIETAYLACDETLRGATNLLIEQPPDYLVATTGIGIRAWLEAAQTWGVAEELMAVLEKAKAVARGAKAAGTLQSAGLSVWERPKSELLSDVLHIMLSEPIQGKRVAVQLYGEPAPEFVAALGDAGAIVTEVPVYQWRMPDDVRAATQLLDQVCAGRVDAVTFTSAPAVRNLFELAERQRRREELIDAFNSGTVAACIGPVCAAAAHDAGVPGAIAPATGRLGLLVRELTSCLDNERRVFTLDGTEFVMQGRALAINDDPVRLTDREHTLFALLVNRWGGVVSRPQLLKQVWGKADADPHVLEVTVGRLRRKLGPAGRRILTVPSRGYRLDVDPARPRADQAPSNLLRQPAS